MSADGMYDHFKYGSSASKKPIDYIEGDTVLRACNDLFGRWYKRLVPLGIDNMAFERSAEKGRSAARRLNDLLRGLFVLQVKGTFILQPYWLSSAANYLADALSRGKVEEFLAAIHQSKFLMPGAVLFERPGAGRTVTLADNPYNDAAAALRSLIGHEARRGEAALQESPRSAASPPGDTCLPLRERCSSLFGIACEASYRVLRSEKGNSMNQGGAECRSDRAVGAHSCWVGS